MRKILAVLLCGIVFEAHAVMFTPEPQPLGTTQDVNPTQASSPAHSSTRKSPEKKRLIPPVKKQVFLPPPSKASLGFYQASTVDNYQMMELYLQQGADINCRNCDSEGNTPMNKALAKFMGDLNSMNHSVIWLVDHGADVNMGNANGVTPLMRSIPLSIDALIRNQWVGTSLGISQLMKLLLDNGAKVTVKDFQGEAPLAYITMVRNGRDLNRTQAERSAFMLALVSLLEHGANINAANNLGNTVLMNAANRCADFSVDTLLTYKADSTIKNKLGETALDMAMAKATQSQDANCNNTVNILRSSNQVRQIPTASPIRQGSTSITATVHSEQQGVSIYVGTYAGTFNGSDTGTFQTKILPTGTVTLIGYSNNGMEFTGEGKVNGDGSIAVGSASTGSTFVGSISQDGECTGTWKNTAYNQAGSFQGKKDAQFVKNQPVKPLQAVGSLLDGIGKLLGVPPMQR